MKQITFFFLFQMDFLNVKSTCRYLKRNFKHVIKQTTMVSIGPLYEKVLKDSLGGKSTIFKEIWISFLFSLFFLFFR